LAEKNALVEVNRRAMEFIWAQCPKEVRDGVEYVVYVDTDIPALYYSGFVDTERFKLTHWEQAFEDCKGDDGKYWIDHRKMIFLGMFRYSKRVGEPFDPLKLKTGKWPVERLWKVYEKSVIPSCSISKEFIQQKFDLIYRKKKDFKEAFSKELTQIADSEEVGDEDKESLSKKTEELQPLLFGTGPEGATVEVDKQHLINLKNFIDTYPSPRRKMELAVQEMRLGKLQNLANLSKESQKSTFEAGKDFRETTKDDLKKLLVKASENKRAGRKTTGEVINISDMNKKRPGPTKF